MTLVDMKPGSLLRPKKWSSADELEVGAAVQERIIVVLMSGVKVSGHIISACSEAITVKGPGSSTTIFKHAICRYQFGSEAHEPAKVKPDMPPPGHV